jgi:isopenicillin-N N-acyltransferase-like protein
VSIPLHTSAAGLAPRTRGEELGRAFATRVATTVCCYRWMLGIECGLLPADVRRLGQTIGERLSARRPALADEIRGIAAGAGVDEATLFAVNARTELLGTAGAQECSTLGAVPREAGATLLLAQNWDWHPAWRDTLLVHLVHQQNGHWFATLTEAGLLGKIGLNSHGLGCALNILDAPEDGILDREPLHVLLRRVLEECGTVDEAGSLLETTRIGASSCVTVAGPSQVGPALLGFELTPDGSRRLEPDATGHYVHTNHRVAADAPSPEPGSMPSSPVRYAELCTRVKELDAPLTPADAQRLLASHENQPASVCTHVDRTDQYCDVTETLASLVMDLSGSTLWLAAGTPCSTPYEKVPLPPRPHPPAAAAPEAPLARRPTAPRSARWS